MIIDLPYPPSGLMPNQRLGKNWKATHQLKKTSRDEAFFLTKTTKDIHLLQFEKTIEIKIIFVQIGKRKKDLDGLLSASKHALDGMAMALGIDDSRFEPITIMRGYDKDKSYMRVVL